MCDFDDTHDVRRVLNLIDYSVCALAKAISLLTAELLAPGRTGIMREVGNAIHDEPTLLLRGEVLNLACGRRLDLEAISCHAASDL